MVKREIVSQNFKALLKPQNFGNLHCLDLLCSIPNAILVLATYLYQLHSFINLYPIPVSNLQFFLLLAYCLSQLLLAFH